MTRTINSSSTNVVVCTQLDSLNTVDLGNSGTTIVGLIQDGMIMFPGLEGSVSDGSRVFLVSKDSDPQNLFDSIKLVQKQLGIPDLGVIFIGTNATSDLEPWRRTFEDSGLVYLGTSQEPFSYLISFEGTNLQSEVGFIFHAASQNNHSGFTSQPTSASLIGEDQLGDSHQDVPPTAASRPSKTSSPSTKENRRLSKRLVTFAFAASILSLFFGMAMYLLSNSLEPPVIIGILSAVLCVAALLNVASQRRLAAKTTKRLDHLEKTITKTLNANQRKTRSRISRESDATTEKFGHKLDVMAGNIAVMKLNQVESQEFQSMPKRELEKFANTSIENSDLD